MKIINSILAKSALLLIAVLGFWSCENDNQIEERSWQLVWEDEFDGPAGQSPDSAKWTYDIGTDWGNAQLEFDTDRPENVSMDGEGNLAIIARRENFGGSAFTSARITTQNLFDQAYGRFEARIKMPWGPGIWPAFWLLGSDITTVGWPQCGEIDIMEYRGQEPNIIHGSVHGPGYSGGEAVTKAFAFEQGRFDTNFHVFAVEWGEDYIDYFVDDEVYFRVRPGDVDGEWVYDHPFYIILNVAVGGNYVGFPTPQTPFPQTMLVDYVRVYKEAGS
ncbi:MAG: glycoside hydrolase family 16 protein [Bacteroidota bacterium]